MQGVCVQGVCVQGATPPRSIVTPARSRARHPHPPCEQNDKTGVKHYLAATSFAGGNEEVLNNTIHLGENRGSFSMLSACHIDTTIIIIHETLKISAKGHGHTEQCPGQR